jgi:hypothetical protein
VQAKAQRIGRHEKRGAQYIQNKMFKEDTRTVYRNLGTKNIQARGPSSMAEVEPYLNSLWGEKYSIMKAERIRREERRKISHMELVPIRTMLITFFLSKAHNWRSPGSDQIQNYWLKAFPATHRHITKNFNAIMEEPKDT